MTSVGYIGLGAMGMPLAMGALAAGFDVWVHDVSQDRVSEATAHGARSAPSPRAVAQRADIVAVVVKGDATVKQVVLDNGILAGAKSEHVLVIHSTVHPGTIHEIAAVASPLGIEVVDAQMTGGRQGAEAHALCFMVGGTPTGIERVRPLLQASAREIHCVGALGAGTAMKLVQQTVFCLNRLAAYEGMRLGEAAGLDLRTVQQILKSTAAQSFVVDNWLSRYRILDNDQKPPGWTMQEFARLLLSLTPALELARDLGVALPATALIQKLFMAEPNQT